MQPFPLKFEKNPYFKMNYQQMQFKYLDTVEKVISSSKNAKNYIKIDQ